MLFCATEFCAVSEILRVGGCIGRFFNKFPDPEHDRGSAPSLLSIPPRLILVQNLTESLSDDSIFLSMLVLLSIRISISRYLTLMLMVTSIDAFRGVDLVEIFYRNEEIREKNQGVEMSDVVRKSHRVTKVDFSEETARKTNIDTIKCVNMGKTNRGEQPRCFQREKLSHACQLHRPPTIFLSISFLYIALIFHSITVYVRMSAPRNFESLRHKVTLVFLTDGMPHGDKHCARSACTSSGREYRRYHQNTFFILVRDSME